MIAIEKPAKVRRVVVANATGLLYQSGSEKLKHE